MTMNGDITKVLPIIALYAFAGYRLIPAMQKIYTSFIALRYVGPALDSLYNDLKNLREKGALVHCITNYVAMNINANTLLSIGASPLMSHARSELGEIAAISSCLVNNIGTNNCTIYSQDISQKSSQLLRLNLILNNLVHSLQNVIEGNTLDSPYHKDKDTNLKKFD